MANMELLDLIAWRTREMMMEAFGFIAQLLIYFALLVAFVILIVEIARIVRPLLPFKEQGGEFQKDPTKGISERLH